MELFQNRLKSFKDTLLEYFVLNLDILFPIEIVVHITKNFASFPIFPKYLFEEILEKSKDMCWKIENHKLITCIVIRKRLKWNNTSIFRFLDFHSYDDYIDFFSDSVHTLRSFIVTYSMPSHEDYGLESLKAISKAVDTLEDLRIRILHQGFRWEIKPHIDTLNTKVETCKPLKLKRLVLAANYFECLPYTLDYDELTVLELEYFTLTSHFLKVLVGFKRLVYFFVYGSLAYELGAGEVVDAVTSLKRLRVLGLNVGNMKVDELMLNKIMNDLESLELLELECIILEHPNKLQIPRRKLKVLNYQRMISSMGNVSVLKDMAHRIGNLDDLEGIMTFISTATTIFSYLDAICKLLYHIKEEDMKTLIEAEKTGKLHIRSTKCLTETIYFGRHRSTSYDVPQRLLGLACYYSKDKVKKLKVNNQNTHLAQKLKEMFGTGQ